MPRLTAETVLAYFETAPLDEAKLVLKLARSKVAARPETPTEAPAPEPQPRRKRKSRRQQNEPAQAALVASP